jgi:hypothetical protein
MLEKKKSNKMQLFCAQNVVPMRKAAVFFYRIVKTVRPKQVLTIA